MYLKLNQKINIVFYSHLIKLIVKISKKVFEQIIKSSLNFHKKKVIYIKKFFT